VANVLYLSNGPLDTLHGVAIVGLILANSFLVAAEFALVSLRATRVSSCWRSPVLVPAPWPSCAAPSTTRSPQCSSRDRRKSGAGVVG